MKLELGKPTVVFFGSSDFATASADIFKAVTECCEVLLAVTRADQPAGRARAIRQTPVAELAEELGIATAKPASLKDPEFEQKIKQLKPDLFIVVSYGKIIPQNLLSIPKFGAINVHPSLLPKYRGTPPIPAALFNGDKKTGVSIMLMDAEMDHGPILTQEQVEIGSTETFLELSARLINLSAELLAKTIPDFMAGKIKPVAQEHAETTYIKMLSKADGKIDWNRSADEIYNQYRAYILWPGIWCNWNGQNLKILKLARANQGDTQSGAVKPGTILQTADKKITAACGSGALELLEVQLAGKKPTTIKEFLNGHRDFIGSVLN